VKKDIFVVSIAIWDTVLLSVYEGYGDSLSNPATGFAYSPETDWRTRSKTVSIRKDGRVSWSVKDVSPLLTNVYLFLQLHHTLSKLSILRDHCLDPLNNTAYRAVRG